MATVTVRMMGTLREASGEAQATVAAEDGTVGSAIRALTSRSRALEEALLDPVTRSPTATALILLNGVEIGNLRGLDTPLTDGDTLVLLPVTHGG